MTAFLTHCQSAAAISAPMLGIESFGQFLAKSYLAEMDGQSVLSSKPTVARPYLNTAQSTIEVIGNLEADWDGYGARPISSTVCTNAQRFLAVSPVEMSSPEITPTSNGTLNLEWASNDAEAYLEIGRTRYSGHIECKHGTTVYLSGKLDEPSTQDSGIQQVLALISGLLHGTSAPSLAQGIQVTDPAF
ncbi:MAG: hypothetical protein WAN12_15435 [Candidatus Acidiferrum sp.]